MKFVILCFPRTGSTLLIEALGAHPAIRQCMEPFNPVVEGDAPWVSWRRQAMTGLYGRQESYLNAKGYLDEGRFDLSRLSRRVFADFDGAKVMYDQLEVFSPVWEHLRDLDDLRVIVLRRNIVEAAVSFKIALETNDWHVSPGAAAPPSPRIAYQTGYFGWFHDHFCAAEDRVVKSFRNHEIIQIDYENLVASWPQMLKNLLSVLGVAPLDIAMPYRKRTHGKIKDLILDFADVKAHYADHPVLARDFETASLAGG